MNKGRIKFMTITLMEAYIIETLKAHPYTYDEVATL